VINLLLAVAAHTLLVFSAPAKGSRRVKQTAGCSAQRHRMTFKEGFTSKSFLGGKKKFFLFFFFWGRGAPIKIFFSRCHCSFHWFIGMVTNTVPILRYLGLLR